MVMGRGANVAQLRPELGRVEFETVNPASWDGKAVPRREWMVEGVITKGSVCLVAGDGGIGKCNGRGTPIIMYDGTIKPVEEVRNGDILMGPDSRPRLVRDTIAGHGPLYRVTPVKGDPYVVNGHHILSLKWTPRTGRPRPSHPVNVPVLEFLALPKQERRHLMGWRAGVDWPRRAVDLDPYLLGQWLGDGTRGFPEITTPDPEVVEAALAEFAPGVRVNRRSAQGHGKAWPVRLSMPNNKRPNPLSAALDHYGIFTDKRIPHDYMANDAAIRLELLAGILDSDGHLISGCYEIIQKRQALAEQIAFVARSLGFAATMRVKMAKSQTSELRPYYRVFISGDVDRIPCRVERKKAKPRQQKKRVLVTGISVEPIGDGDYFGFEVDADHLYLLGDFTVTHNSLAMQQLCTSAALGRPWLGLSCVAGRSLFFGCEDDRDELWRRQYDICRSMGASLTDVGEAGLELAPRVGFDNTLSQLNRKDWRMVVTDLFLRLAQKCQDLGISYVVIDTATQTFGGNQNDEQQVVQFCNQLRRLAVAIQGCVIITKHPSVAGRSLGTGESGSVSWSNSVRSRLYLARNKDDQTVLKTMKNNYGRIGETIPLRWERGCFVREDAAAGPSPSWGYRD